MSTTVTLTGRLGADPEVRFTKSGKPVTSFTMVTSRKRKQQDGSWEESETTWYQVTCWDQMAENVAESLLKGDPVIVVGRLFMDSYEKPDGTRMQSLKVEAYAVGPDLKWGQARLKKAERKAVSAPADDPWSSPPSGALEDIPF